MEVDLISKFLGCEQDEGTIEPTKYASFTYNSPKLAYGVFIDIENKVLGVSADFNVPFGHACISEVSADFDRITIETEPDFYAEDEILVCRKDYEGKNGIATLKVKKWGDGELSIWMSRVASCE